MFCGLSQRHTSNAVKVLAIRDGQGAGLERTTCQPTQTIRYGLTQV